MTFCTIVEFEWDEDFDHEGFRRALGRLSEESPSPTGPLATAVACDRPVMTAGGWIHEFMPLFHRNIK